MDAHQMTRPQHYRLAEIAQQAAADIQANREPGPEASVVEALLDAEVHALLDIADAIRERGKPVIVVQYTGETTEGLAAKIRNAMKMAQGS